MPPFIKLIRPTHWIKNVFVLSPLLFSCKYSGENALNNVYATLLAFAAFCLASSTVYVVNDISDCQKDSYHPVKRNRPVPSGQVTKSQAWIIAAILLLVSVIISFIISPLFLVITSIYLGMNLLYSFWLKSYAIIDVIIIAIGFVLRAAGGAVAIQVFASQWLIVCIFTLCLFMGFCKRINEIVTLGQSMAVNHRQSLLEYTPELLTHLITTSAALAIITFMLYGMSDATIERFGTSAFIYTVPVVTYCIFRFAAISMKGLYDGPTSIVLKDKPFLIGTVIWVTMAVLIVTKGNCFGTFCRSLY